MPIADLRLQPRLEVAVSPNRYTSQAMTREQMFGALSSSAVNARGWSFPYYDERCVLVGPNERYIGGEIDFTTAVVHLEEWRLYSSGQFLLRMRPWEVPDQEWQRKVRDTFNSRGRQLSESVVGFLAFDLLIFSVTEAYIFAGRLAQSMPYDGMIDIKIGLKSVQGYALASRDEQRRLYDAYMTTIDNPHDDVTMPIDALVADPKAAAATALIRLFRQFRWHDPPTRETIRQLQLAYY